MVKEIWFALIETGRLCLASLSNGAWQRISNQQILHGVEDELLAALDQEAILFSGRKEAAESVYLFAPEYPELRLPADCGWHIISLQTESMLAPLALSGTCHDFGQEKLMRSLRLKFPDRGQEARNAGYAMLLLGIFALAGVLYQFKMAMDEVAYWDSRITAMDRRAQRKTTPQFSPGRGSREIKQEIKKANTVMSEIDLPWEALFDSVEYASSHDVALLSFQPDAAGRKMRDRRRSEKYAGDAGFCRRPGARTGSQGCPSAQV